MSKSFDRVFHGFINLSRSEQEEFLKKANEFMDSSKNKKYLIKESARKDLGITAGPVDAGGCPCCGK